MGKITFIVFLFSTSLLAGDCETELIARIAAFLSNKGVVSFEDDEFAVGKTIAREMHAVIAASEIPEAKVRHAYRSAYFAFRRQFGDELICVLARVALQLDIEPTLLRPYASEDRLADHGEATYFRWILNSVEIDVRSGRLQLLPK